MLLEVLLGLALVAIAILVLFQLFPFVDRAVYMADETAQATQLARRVMQGQMALDYAAVVSTTGTETISHGLRRGAVLTTEYTWRVDVSDLPSPQKLKRITVTVTWMYGTGSRALNRSVRYETLRGMLW